MKFLIIINLLLTGCVAIILEEPKIEKTRMPDIVSERANIKDYYTFDIECDCWLWGDTKKKKIKGKVIIGDPFIEGVDEN